VVVRRHSIGVAVALALAVTCRARAAPSPDWTRFATPLVIPLTHEQGLPPGVVSGLARDGDGFIWIATQGGLARWDGHAMRVFSDQHDGERPWPGGLITGLTADESGAIWIVFNDGTTGRYDRTTERFTIFQTPGKRVGAPIGLASNGNGGVWIDGRDGLAQLDPASGAWRSIPADVAGRPERYNYGLLRARDGTLWLQRGRRLGRLRDGRFDLITPPLPPPRESGSDLDANVTALLEDHEGTLWFGLRGGYVGRVRRDALVAELLPEFATPGHYAGSLAEVLPGLVCAGVYGAGLACLDVKSGTIRRIPYDATAGSGAMDRQIQYLLAGPAGLLWMGSSRGVHLLVLSGQPVSTLMNSGPDARDLSDGDVTSIAQASGDRMWLGLAQRGLDLFDRLAGRVATIRTAGAAGPPISESEITSLLRDPDGRLLAATVSGLLAIDERAPAARLIAGTPPGGLLLRQIGRDLWVGTNAGLFKVMPDARQTRHFEHDARDPASLAGSRINDLLPASSGRLWVATGRGLDLFDPATGQARHFVHKADDPESLPSDVVWTLAEDKQGRLWVGSAGGGIGILDQRVLADPAVRFRRIGRAQGLRNANIDKLLEDDAGRMWAATDDGIAVIDTRSLSVVRTLSRADGQAITHYWLGSGARLADGTLLFGGQGGLSVINPDRLGGAPPPASVRVTDVRIDGKRGSGGAPIVLPPGARGVQIEFSALEYVVPELCRYSYRLEGFDPDWIEVDPQHRVAAYTTLPPGDYRLLVRAARRDEPWTTASLDLPVIVVPAWYQTFWFRGVEVLAAGLALFGMVRARTASLERRRRQLEREVADRTQALAMAAEALRAANAELEHVANHDALTGLPNRRRFFQAAEEALAASRRYDHDCAVFVADLDYFKRINDLHGHAAGDAALRAAAGCLGFTLREADVGARYGGEELAALLPETDIDGATEAAERFRLALEGTEVVHEGRVIGVTVSIGVSVWSHEEADIGAAIMRADAALYRAKDAGRNRVAVEMPQTAGAAPYGLAEPVDTSTPRPPS
jgi:diguanylate cyclase (GGDEF)-like protein